MTTDAVPNIDEVVRAAWNATAPHNKWITEIGDGYVIVVSDPDRTFARVPVDIGDTVTFGTAEPVVPGYIAAEPVAAARVVYASRAESRPDVEPSPDQEPLPGVVPNGAPADPRDDPEDVPAAEPDNPPIQEDDVSLSDVAVRLGLDPGADKAEILAALDKRAQSVQPSNEPAPDGQPDGDQPATPEPAVPQQPAPTQPETQPEPVAASVLPAEVQQQLAMLTQQVQQMSAQLAASNAEKAAAIKAAVLGEAKRLGKFAPADESTWSRHYDAAPEVTTQVLASIAPGTAVPVAASGYTGTGEETTDPDAVNASEASDWARMLGISAEELTRG